MHTEQRAVRSYVIREGRMTRAQARALDELLPIYGVEPAALAKPETLLGRRLPVILEIGIGNGDNLLAMAERAPGTLHLGCEVHRPGVGHTLHEVHARGLRNVRLVSADALDALAALPPESLDTVCMFFPDPWPKKRHHKRRLLSAEVLERIARVLKPSGRFCFASDDQSYAEAALAVISAAPAWRNLAGQDGFAPRPCWRTITRFEQRARRDGRAVFDLVAAPRWYP